MSRKLFWRVITAWGASIWKITKRLRWMVSRGKIHSRAVRDYLVIPRCKSERKVRKALEHVTWDHQHRTKRIHGQEAIPVLEVWEFPHMEADIIGIAVTKVLYTFHHLPDGMLTCHKKIATFNTQIRRADSKAGDQRRHPCRAQFIHKAAGASTILVGSILWDNFLYLTLP